MRSGGDLQGSAGQGTSVWRKTSTWVLLLSVLLLLQWMTFVYVSLSYRSVVQTLEHEQHAYRLKAQKYRLLQTKYKELNASFVDMANDHLEYMEVVQRARSNTKFFKENARVEMQRRARLEKSNSVLEYKIENLYKQMNGLQSSFGSYLSLADNLRGLNGQATFLTIGIPTVPRAAIDYLTGTIKALAAQLREYTNEPGALRVKVLVMNNKPGQHPVFERLRKEYESNAAFEFRENTDGYADPYPQLPDPDDSNNPTDRPGHRVRKQTCDVASMARAAMGMSDYFMFMEDDFILCPGALKTMVYILRKVAMVKPDFSAVRLSYGMNGIMVPSADLGPLATYLMDQVAIKPPDLLIIKWMASMDDKTRSYVQGRQNFAFRYNLLYHIGVQSSLRDTRMAARFPTCWAEYGHVLWSQENFKGALCPNDDLWPCDQFESIDTARASMDQFLFSRLFVRTAGDQVQLVIKGGNQAITFARNVPMKPEDFQIKL